MFHGLVRGKPSYGMAEHLLQRFAAMGNPGTTSSTSGPPIPAAAASSSMATLTHRVHHEPFVRYPVYGPGSGPEVYEDDGPYSWHGESGPAFGGHPGPFPGPHGPIVPPPPPPPPPPPFHMPFGRFGQARFKGASVAVLTFIGFLFFLSVLQNYIRDYSTTGTPTGGFLESLSRLKFSIKPASRSLPEDRHNNSEKLFGSNQKVIVLSSGATKENLPPYSSSLSSFLQKNDHHHAQHHFHLSGEDDDRLDDRRYGGGSSYSSKKGNGHGGKRHKGTQKRHSTDAVSAPPPAAASYSDLLNIDGLKKK